MSSDGIELPPVIELLLSEIEPCDSPESFVDAIRRRDGLGQEIRRLASDSDAHWNYERAAATDGALAICPAADLNPFGPGGCGHPKCKTDSATRFARTVGLYAERIIIPDPVTALVYPGDPEFPDPDEIAAGRLEALRAVEPLLRAGIIKFGRPTERSYCEEHWNVFKDFCSDAAKIIARDIADNVLFAMEKSGPGPRDWLLRLSVDGGESSAPWHLTTGLPHGVRASPKLIRPKANERRFLKKYIDRRALSIAMRLTFTAELAIETHSILAAGNPVSAKAIGSIRGRPTTRPQYEELESLQSMSLPWVDQLSADEIVRLRAEASSALPQFRAHVSTALRENEDDKGVQNAMAILRNEAARVQAELAAVESGRLHRKSSAVRSVVSFSGFFLALFTTGAAPAYAAAALAAALAAVTANHSHGGNDRVEETKLRSSPGYLLLKAKDLLTHRS